MPRYRRYFAPGQSVFLTLVCQGRRPWLREEGARHATLAALHDARRIYPFRHYGHVLLDDHLHLLLAPAEGVAVPSLVGSFKRATTARMRERANGRLWQRRYFDHVIRDADDLQRHLDYIHFNPVRHGLVDRAQAWPWSSFSAWVARGAYSSDWASNESSEIQIAGE